MPSMKHYEELELGRCDLSRVLRLTVRDGAREASDRVVFSIYEYNRIICVGRPLIHGSS